LKKEGKFSRIQPEPDICIVKSDRKVDINLEKAVDFLSGIWGENKFISKYLESGEKGLLCPQRSFKISPKGKTCGSMLKLPVLYLYQTNMAVLNGLMS